ncbi:MAG TPA: jacalin-like lectin, partial [Catenuloplanes sp.]
VAGLPALISSGSPAVNTTAIGQRLDRYDIVHVQEDFNYHAALYAADRHPYRSATSGGVPFGDGMNTLSRFPITDLTRVKWAKCNGTDCLTPKGFSWNRVRLAEGVHLDLYNAHPNAGSADADLAARRANITQLSQFIAANSAGNAVIVMGDTNTRYTRGRDNIRELLQTNGLTDAWVEHQRGGVPPAIDTPGLVCDPAAVTSSCEVVDKILYRGNRFISLRATGYENDNKAFLDAAGKPLSDHYPHTARFSWTLQPDLRLSDTAGGPHGTPFTDLDRVVPRARVERLTVRGGSRLDQVALTRADGTTLVHGGNGGTPSTLPLAAGEQLTQVTLSWGKKDGRTRVFSARFATNHARVLAAGRPTGDAVTYTAPAGWQIAGFHGRSGAELDSLGVIFTPAGS